MHGQRPLQNSRRMKTVDYNKMRLVKYTKLIDKSILHKRYSLSTHLAYRCLLEYYRLFIRFRFPNQQLLTKNAFQLSLEVVAYFSANKHWFKFRKSSDMLQLLSSTYYLTTLSKYRSANRDLHVDRVTATYARNQSLAIAQFLIRAMHDQRPAK